jgi:hypothetical protein
MTYACPTWVVAAGAFLLKLQCLKNEVHRTIVNFPRRIPVHNLHTAFDLPYVCDYITKLGKQQAKVMKNN